jgi:hypothetical protein
MINLNKTYTLMIRIVHYAWRKVGTNSTGKARL